MKHEKVNFENPAPSYHYSVGEKIVIPCATVPGPTLRFKVTKVTATTITMTRYWSLAEQLVFLFYCLTILSFVLIAAERALL